MHSTKYIIGFIVILTAVVAVMLTGLREATKAKADQNEKIFEKRAVLTSVEDYLPEGKTVNDLSDQDVLDLFETQMDQKVLDASGEEDGSVQTENLDLAKEKKKSVDERRFPLYIFDSGEETLYIIAVRGKGLWDEIWGYIALKSDLNTIAGASFDHKGETPGLGAEIKDNPSFPAQFEGKTIYDDQGKFVSVTVRKGGTKNDPHAVDAISGATVTSVGVADMLREGISYYEPFFQKIRRQSMVNN